MRLQIFGSFIAILAVGVSAIPLNVADTARQNKLIARAGGSVSPSSVNSDNTDQTRMLAASNRLLELNERQLDGIRQQIEAITNFYRLHTAIKPNEPLSFRLATQQQQRIEALESDVRALKERQAEFIQTSFQHESEEDESSVHSYVSEEEDEDQVHSNAYTATYYVQSQLEGSPELESPIEAPLASPQQLPPAAPFLNPQPSPSALSLQPDFALPDGAMASEQALLSPLSPLAESELHNAQLTIADWMAAGLATPGEEEMQMSGILASPPPIGRLLSDGSMQDAEVAPQYSNDDGN